MTETVRKILAAKDGGVWSVGPGDTVYDAIAVMMDKGVGALLVMRNGELVGIISERDYARKVILLGRASRSTPVSEIMTSPVVTVTPEHTADACMRIMTEHHIRHLPVVDSGTVAGVVSIGDLVKSIISAQAQTIGDLHTYISGSYPK